jgi:hypothetical protein
MLRKAATAGAFGMALALAQAPANADDNLYGATGSSKTPSSLYTIDPATGAATQVGEIGFNHVVSIDFHPITGVLYGISNSGPDRSLITIDPATGAGTLVAHISPPINSTAFNSPDMSFDTAGTLYTWSEPGIDRLTTVDLTTGAATHIGPSPLGTFSLGLDIDSTDTIYIKNGDGRVYTVNAGTGATTLVAEGIGSTLFFNNVLAFDAADTLYTVHRLDFDSELYTIDLASATTTLVGATGLGNLAALAFRPDAIATNVPVDIKATSCPNPLNVGSKGVLPVAVLGTASFDATEIDVTTVSVLGVTPLRSNLEDVATPFEPFSGKEDALDCNEEGGDGFTDLILKFDKQAVIAALGPVNDGEVVVVPVTGELLTGTAFDGEDVIVIKEYW